MEWREMQSAYYRLMNSRKSSKCWLIAVIRKVWMIAWDLWEHHNSILHEQENLQTDALHKETNRRARKLYAKAVNLVANTTDNYLLSLPLGDLLKKNMTYKKAWVANAEVATLFHIRNEVRQARDLLWMRQALDRWLNKG
jgi:hypothetical protein